MTKAALKKKIHEAIDQIDDVRVLKMILTVVENHLAEIELTAEQKKKKVKS